MNLNKQLYNYEHNGGKILGHGAWGEVMDTCINDFESLCNIIDPINDKIEIYSDNGQKFLIHNTNDFLQFIESYHGISKTFSREDKFLREIEENINVINIHQHKPQYITLDIPTYKNINVFGFAIKKSNGKHIYVILGKKCNPKYSLDYTNIFQFIKDILKRIKAINSQNYYHNDIKLANIILC